MQCCKASSRETRCYADGNLLGIEYISFSKYWQLLSALTRLIVYVLPEISTHGATIDNIQNLLQEEIANKSHPWCAISLTLLSTQLQNMAMRFGGLCKLRKWKDYIMNSANSRGALITTPNLACYGVMLGRVLLLIQWKVSMVNSISECWLHG